MTSLNCHVVGEWEHIHEEFESASAGGENRKERSEARRDVGEAILRATKPGRIYE
jgi:hypothetical protein